MCLIQTTVPAPHPDIKYATRPRIRSESALIISLMAPLDKQFFYQINSNFAPHLRAVMSAVLPSTAAPKSLIQRTRQRSGNLRRLLL